MMKKVLLGTGCLGWPRSERVSDRYGVVGLFSPPSGDPNDHFGGERSQIQTLIPDGIGRLTFVVKKLCPSPHIGDLFRGLCPHPAPVGEEIVLSEKGTFFSSNDQGTCAYVGVDPGDGRASDWLNSVQLYRGVDQWGDLYAEVEDE